MFSLKEVDLFCFYCPIGPFPTLVNPKLSQSISLVNRRDLLTFCSSQQLFLLPMSDDHSYPDWQADNIQIHEIPFLYF